MYKYPVVSTTEDELIPHSVDSTTIRPLQQIVSTDINLSDQSTTSKPTSDHLYYIMLSFKDIDFTHVTYNFNKCRERAETAGHYYSCLYLDEEDMELTSEDDYEVSKKDKTEVSSNKESLSQIQEEVIK